MLLREQRFPTRWDLDAVAPDHPVVLQRTWNKLVVNSLALQICGIDRDIVWPPGDLLYAGEVLRNDSGELTGVFSDRAKDLVLRRLRLTSEQMQECIAVACRAYNSVGITSIVDPGLRPEEMRAYHAVRVRGDLTVRISMCVGAWGHTSVYAGEEAGLYERIHGIGVYTGFGDEWLRLDCVKIMPDGGGSDGTALMYEPFASNPESRGHATVPVEEIPNYVWFCHERGWSVDAHACGDRMLDIVVEAMATAYRRRPSTSVRHRVHHAYFAGPKALALMAEHRIAAITQPIFLWSQGENMIHHFGLERALRLMPARAFLEAGVPLAFSSDSPVADYNPWMGMYAALTRSSLNGFQFSRVDVVTREEALRAYTIDAAWMTFEEHLKGSIGPGKLADLVVLDRDYLTCPLEEVKDIRPVATMVGGRWVYGHM
jgi:predicted amidohydrolase YtcJ